MAALIRVRAPANYLPERAYVLRVVLSDWLGLEINLQWNDPASEWIALELPNGQTLQVRDVFLSVPEDVWLSTNSLPEPPLPRWSLSAAALGDVATSRDLPIISGRKLKEGGWWARDQRGIRLGVDIFGAVFFCLSLYEEVVSDRRDRHDRFLGRWSVAYRDGWHERPLANEYALILARCLELLSPGLAPETPDYVPVLTHDVDRPFRYQTVRQTLGAAGSSLLRRGDLVAAGEWIVGGIKSIGGALRDPFFRDLQYLTDIAESSGHVATFNLMTAPASEWDTGYELKGPLEEFVHEALARGHQAGFHPGYHTYDDPEAFSDQLDRLRGAVTGDIRGGRQHYLRFAAPRTWRIWSATDLGYDSTLGFADLAGFRCGSCWPFPVFDLQERVRLPLTERPLVAMDGSLRGEDYANLSSREALATLETLVDACRSVGGEFVVNWHNSSLSGEWKGWREVYERLVRDIL